MVLAKLNQIACGDYLKILKFMHIFIQNAT
jgi:hypothetical protein